MLLILRLKEGLLARVIDRMISFSKKIGARSVTKSSCWRLSSIMTSSCAQAWRLTEHPLSIVVESRLLLRVHSLLQLHKTLEHLVCDDFFRGLLWLLLELRLVVVHCTVKVRIQ